MAGDANRKRTSQKQRVLFTVRDFCGPEKG